VIRLVPEEQPKALSIDAALESANGAYTKARAAQRKLVANLHLTELLYRPGKVSYARLKGELRAAREQVERAQAVTDALLEAVEALEATDPVAAQARRNREGR
jgi:hypothetical protein